MQRKRIQKQTRNHYVIFVNTGAANYKRPWVSRLIEFVKTSGGNYSIFESENAEYLRQTALKVCGLKRWHHSAPAAVFKRGDPTALVACGGDGTFNLVASVAWQAELPVGFLPFGKMNDICRSLLGTDQPEEGLRRIQQKSYRKVDVGEVGGQVFFGSFGIGFTAALRQQLHDRKRPRFGIGWSQLGARAVESVVPKETTIKMGAFRFDVSPFLLNINLLTYSTGLPLSPVSITDDRQMEIIFDTGEDKKIFGTFIKQIHKKKYLYNGGIRLFRGSSVSLQNLKGSIASLDGELITIKEDLINVSVAEKQLKVFC